MGHITFINTHFLIHTLLAPQLLTSQLIHILASQNNNHLAQIVVIVSLNITQTLTRIFKTHFNKNVSTTLLRHIVLTEKFGKQLQEMEAMADVMGHNISTAQSVYIKNVDADA